MFWMNFLRLCNQVDKSPNAVAAEIGIKSSGSVTAWKNGTVPYARTLQKIADYFGVSVDELRGDDPEKPSKKEKPTAQGDGLTEKDVALIKWFRSLPEEKLRAILISQDAPEELLD